MACQAQIDHKNDTGHDPSGAKRSALEVSAELGVAAND
jgi:hypothetical protein